MVHFWGHGKGSTSSVSLPPILFDLLDFEFHAEGLFMFVEVGLESEGLVASGADIGLGV